MDNQRIAKQLLDELSAEHRSAGSDAELRVREKCKTLLQAASFEVDNQKFSFKIFSFLKGIRRVQSANLIAVRGRPKLWLVAHSDTKSQLMPPALRVIGAVIFLAGLVLLPAGLLFDFWCLPVALLTVGAIPLFLNPIGNRSPGAVDNASGMVAVLLAVQSLPKDIPLGVLITSAEERFMAGARNFVRKYPPAVAINCDGLDDHGRLRCWYNRGQKQFAQTVAPDHASGVPPGILLDATILARHGWKAVTVSKGTWRTLWRIHTPLDTSDRLTGQGIAEGVDLIRKIVLSLGKTL